MIQLDCKINKRKEAIKMEEIKVIKQAINDFETKRELLISLVNDLIADNTNNGDEQSKVGIDMTIDRILYTFEIADWELQKDLENR